MSGAKIFRASSGVKYCFHQDPNLIISLVGEGKERLCAYLCILYDPVSGDDSSRSLDVRRRHELLEIGIATCGRLVMIHTYLEQSLGFGGCGCHFFFVTAAALENVVTGTL